MENQAQTGDNMVTVTYDKDRKTVTFYDTFVDINGEVIKYDDIAVIQSGAMDHSFMYYIVFGNSFTYNFDFTTYDGNKHKFKRYGLSVYLEITKDKITYVKNKKKTYVIDRSNFDRAVNNSSYAASYAEIYIRDEKKPVFRVSLNEPNARLIVPIVNTFFEFRINEAAAGTQG